MNAMENGCVLVIIGIVIVMFAIMVWRFVQMPSDEQLNKVREWLIFAVTKAEKELGSGTGKIKLRYVYDMFVEKFAWIAKAITFEMFSTMVDEALESMRDLLAKNSAVRDLVSKERG